MPKSERDSANKLCTNPPYVVAGGAEADSSHRPRGTDAGDDSARITSSRNRGALDTEPLNLKADEMITTSALLFALRDHGLF